MYVLSYCVNVEINVYYILQGKYEWRRGIPKNSWMDCVKNVMIEKGVSVELRAYAGECISYSIAQEFFFNFIVT